MKYNFKEIHIGRMIQQRVEESEIEISRICHFLKATEQEINNMYALESIDTYMLLRWSKLLEYDFFRIYGQHLILYAPPNHKGKASKSKNAISKLPSFKKNIYTIEVIEFIIELISQNKKTSVQIVEEYNIPRTTLYKWMAKYKE